MQSYGQALKMKNNNKNNIDRYSMNIYWSSEDQSYLVEVPELPGCMADGKTREEVIQNAVVIIEEWIETARESGREIPAPRGVTVG